jgi:hypothetical protein
MTAETTVVSRAGANSPAMSSYALLQALTGARCDAVEKVL